MTAQVPGLGVAPVSVAPEQNGVKVPAPSDVPAQSNSFRHGIPQVEPQVGHFETHVKPQSHPAFDLHVAP